MSRDHDADFGHLPSPVRTWFVCDHHNLVEEQHGGTDGAAGAPGQVLGPDRHPRAQLERVEIDVAEPQRCRTQPVATRVDFLLHHAVRQQGADQAVNRGRCQVDGGRDLAEAHSAAALQHRKDPQRTIHGLDHPSTFRRNRPL